MIGLFNIEKTVRDLGASVNLLLYLIYKQVGLGELKLSHVTWQLSDKSKWHPKWVIKDVLMQIDNFYFPMDFIVIDAVPIKTLVFKSHLSLDIYFYLPLTQSVTSCFQHTAYKYAQQMPITYSVWIY